MSKLETSKPAVETVDLSYIHAENEEERNKAQDHELALGASNHSSPACVSKLVLNVMQALFKADAL